MGARKLTDGVHDTSGLTGLAIPLDKYPVLRHRHVKRLLKQFTMLRGVSQGERKGLRELCRVASITLVGVTKRGCEIDGTKPTNANRGSQGAPILKRYARKGTNQAVLANLGGGVDDRLWADTSWDRRFGLTTWLRRLRRDDPLLTAAGRRRTRRRSSRRRLGRARFHSTRPPYDRDLSPGSCRKPVLHIRLVEKNGRWRIYAPRRSSLPDIGAPAPQTNRPCGGD